MFVVFNTYYNVLFCVVNILFNSIIPFCFFNQVEERGMGSTLNFKRTTKVFIKTPGSFIYIVFLLFTSFLYFKATLTVASYNFLSIISLTSDESYILKRSPPKRTGPGKLQKISYLILNDFHCRYLLLGSRWCILNACPKT